MSIFMTEHIELNKGNEALGFSFFNEQLMKATVKQAPIASGPSMAERSKLVSKGDVQYDKNRLQQLRAFSTNLGKSSIGMDTGLRFNDVNANAVAEVETKHGDDKKKEVIIVAALVILLTVLSKIQMNKLQSRSDTSSMLDQTAKALAINAQNTADKSIAYADRVDALTQQLEERSKTPLWEKIATGGIMLLISIISANPALIVSTILLLAIEFSPIMGWVGDKLGPVAQLALLMLVVFAAIAITVAVPTSEPFTAGTVAGSLEEGASEETVATTARGAASEAAASGGLSNVIQNSLFVFTQGHGIQYLLESAGVNKDDAQKADMIVAALVAAITMLGSMGLFAKSATNVVLDDQVEKLAQKIMDNKDALSETFATSRMKKLAFKVAKYVAGFAGKAQSMAMLFQLGMNGYNIYQQAQLKEGYEELSAALKALSQPLADLHMETFSEKAFSTGAQQQTGIAEEQMKALAAIADDIRTSIKNLAIQSRAA